MVLGSLNLQIIKSYFYLIILVALSMLTILFLSTSTSFLFSYKEQLDSVVFQVIGREWLNGIIPYKDLWDLKGPMIFFLNSLGYLMTGSRYGILIIQILFLFISLLLTFLYFRKITSSVKAYAVVIIMCIMLSFVYEGGNMVEEYALPLLVCSFIKMNNWLDNVKDGIYSHKYLFSIVYGLTLAFSFLTRLTNALPLCAGVTYIFIFLIIKGKWRNFICNLVAFVIGFFILVVPFFIYFYFSNALQDYFFTLKFCFNYLSQSDHPIIIKNLILFNFPVFLLLAVIFIRLFHERCYHKFFLWGGVIFTSLYWIVNSRGYYHYSIIFIPYMAIAMYEIIYLKIKWRRILFVVLCLFIVRGLKHDVSYYKMLDDVKESNLLLERAMEMIPDSNKRYTYIYGDIITPYLYQGVCPYKFFYLQDENADISPIYRCEMMKELYINKPIYIVTGSSAKALQNFLDKEYTICYSDPRVNIYSKIE